MDNNERQERIPLKVRKKQRDRKIKALYSAGYSMNEICVKEGHSKTTVFFAINGRSSKRRRKNPKN